MPVENTPILQTPPVVYVVDDDSALREALEELLRSRGLRAKSFGSAREFLDRLAYEFPACLILDQDLPGMSGLELQNELSRSKVEIPTVFISGHGNIPKTVRAIKAGALDFFSKPFDPDDLLDAVKEGIARAEFIALARVPAAFGDFVGSSTALKTVLEQIQLVATTETTVLVTGESGTGKELVARAIHQHSARGKGPLIKVNCGAVPETLFESEFFGHVRGAFTGAMRDKPGKFELAQGGSLFLDEIGEVPLGMQAKLLRALQEREVERVGDTRSRRLDVRIIAATNRDLLAEVEAGRFRRDLFYRLSVFPIHNPPLRERHEDVHRLVRHFTDKFSRQMKKRIRRILPETMEVLVAHSWPGNVRELQNIIERAVILSPGDVLCVPLTELKREVSKAGEHTQDLKEVERDCIFRALAETHWRVGGPRGAAVRLGLKRTTLLSRMEKLGIGRHDVAPDAAVG